MLLIVQDILLLQLKLVIDKIIFYLKSLKGVAYMMTSNVNFGHLPKEIQTYFSNGETEYSKNNLSTIRVMPYPACFTALGYKGLGDRKGTLLKMSDQWNQAVANILFINGVAVQMFFTDKIGFVKTLGQLNLAVPSDRFSNMENEPAIFNLPLDTTASSIDEVKQFLG